MDEIVCPTARKKPGRDRPIHGDNSQTEELKAQIRALERELGATKFKALYYSTLVQVAEQELGVDLEKIRYQAIRVMLMNNPHLHIRQLEGWLGFSGYCFVYKLLNVSEENPSNV